MILNIIKENIVTQDLSYTNAIKNNIVSLPIHTIMSEEELDYLFTTVKSYFIKL